MEYGDEKWHLNQLLGQDVKIGLDQWPFQEPIGLEVPTIYKAYF